MAAQNKQLGRFDLEDIPPAPRGVPQIEVTFDIDANGIVNVEAMDKATKKKQSITIQTSGGLSDDEVERLVKEAEEYAEEDQKRKKMIELKNQADSTVYEGRKTVEKYKDQVGAEVIQAVEDAIAKVESLSQGEDADALEAALAEFQSSISEIGKNVYKNNPDAGAGAEDGSQQGEEPKAEEAEYEETPKDDKK